MAKNQTWATPENDEYVEPDPHIKGTIVRNPSGKRGRRTDFWLTMPCPKGISPDDWEAQQQAKWDRIFGHKEK